MKNVIIYYFSGTGNTYLIAKKVKSSFIRHDYSCTLVNIENIEHVGNDNNQATASPEFIGLLFPVAMQSTFPLVWNFINEMPKTDGQKVFMMDTMASFSGGIVGPVKRVLKSKGYDCIGAIELKMTSSLPKKDIYPEKNILKNAQAVKRAELFIDELLASKTKWHSIPILSDFMRMFSKRRTVWNMLSKRIQINHTKCNCCKLCIKKCPVNCITLIDGEIKIDNKECISCMRCFKECPEHAFWLK